MLDILGAIVTLFIIGIPVWAIISFIFGAANDYGKPRQKRRRSSPQKKRNYYSNSKRPSEFQYFDNEAPEEFLVYFIENPKLNALKIGVGRAGRVHQLLNSYNARTEESDKVGWQVLRVGQFSWSYEDYEKGRGKAYEAERRVKFYWKSQGLEPFLKDEQMGYSKVIKKTSDETIWIRTPGWSETVEMGKVCEVSSWKYVTSSPGYIMESSEFPQGRDLHLLNPQHAERLRPPDLKFPSIKKTAIKTSQEIAMESEKNVPTSKRAYKSIPKSDGTPEGAFWARTGSTDENGCMIWTGAKFEAGYGLIVWDGKSMPAHRVAWWLRFREELEDSRLTNKCGNRLCVNVEHWHKDNKQVLECVIEFCNRPSRTVFKSGMCERCYQRSKRIRRAIREGVSEKCAANGCDNRSFSAKAYCVDCYPKHRTIDDEPSA